MDQFSSGAQSIVMDEDGVIKSGVKGGGFYPVLYYVHTPHSSAASASLYIPCTLHRLCIRSTAHRSLDQIVYIFNKKLLSNSMSKKNIFQGSLSQAADISHFLSKIQRRGRKGSQRDDIVAESLCGMTIFIVKYEWKLMD